MILCSVMGYPPPLRPILSSPPPKKNPHFSFLHFYLIKIRSPSGSPRKEVLQTRVSGSPPRSVLRDPSPRILSPLVCHPFNLTPLIAPQISPKTALRAITATMMHQREREQRSYYGRGGIETVVLGPTFLRLGTCSPKYLLIGLAPGFGINLAS